MEKLTTMDQQESLSIQENADETRKKSSSLTEREKIENTPFWAVRTDEGWFLVMGEYRITEPVESKIIAIDKLKTNKWEIMMRMSAIITEKTIAGIGQLVEESNKEEALKINKGNGG